MRYFLLIYSILFFNSCFLRAASGFLGNDTTICGDTTFLLDAGSGFKSYLWSTGDTTQKISVSKTSTYFVKLKDYQNVKSFDTIFVAFSKAPEVDLGKDTLLCSVNKYKLNAGPNNLYDYVWSTGDTTAKIWVSTTGKFAVKVTDKFGCITYDTIKLVFKAMPKVYLGEDTVVCNGVPLLLDAGYGYKKYKWSTGDSLQSIIVTQSGKYGVKVKDSVGCVFKDKINVYIDTLPKVDLPGFTTLCSQSSVIIKLDNMYKEFQWSTGDTTKAIQIQSTGVYEVTVSDVYGCSSSDSTNVIMDTLADVSLGADKVLCQGDSLVLDVGQNYMNYLWSNGDTSHKTLVNTPGLYYIYVKKNNYCFSADSVQIIYKNISPINLGNNLFTCYGDSLMLDAGNGYMEYHWSNMDTAQQTFVDTGGTYFVVAIDSNGCINSGMVEVFSSNILPVNLGTDTCIKDPFRLHAGSQYVSYLWSTGETDSVIIVINAGLYYVEVTDSNGCKSRDSIYVEICSLHAIENENSYHTIYFNNPINDNLLVSYNESILRINEIQIINSVGQVQILQKNNLQHPIQINTQKLTSGLSWIVFYTNKGVVTKPLIKLN